MQEVCTAKEWPVPWTRESESLFLFEFVGQFGNNSKLDHSIHIFVVKKHAL